MYINSLSTAVTKSELILYADDAVLVVAASTSRELTDALQHDFNEISNWYISNKLTVNVKKTKLMLSGSKTMLSSFSDFTFSAGEDQVNRVSSFNYLGVVLDEKWKWKMHVNSLLQKLGHRLSVFNRIYHMLDEKSLTAYFNGLVLPHLQSRTKVVGTLELGHISPIPPNQCWKISRFFQQKEKKITRLSTL